MKRNNWVSFLLSSITLIVQVPELILKPKNPKIFLPYLSKEVQLHITHLDFFISSALCVKWGF